MLPVLLIGAALGAASAAFIAWSVSIPVDSFDFLGAAPHPTHRMKAAAYSKHQTALEVSLDYPVPTIKSNQILVQVHFASFNPVDYKLRRNSHLIPSIIVPNAKVPGCDLAGQVGEYYACVLSSSVMMMEASILTTRTTCFQSRSVRPCVPLRWATAWWP
jgi:hypothetical protein